MAFGILNTVIPPAPQVNSVDFNTIMLVGIAPKGPKQTLTLCGSDTEDSVFGKCLTGFNIPIALDTIRRSGGGKVALVNVFDPAAHTSQVTNENATVTAQKAKSAYNPIEITAVVATSAQSVTTGAGSNDTLASINVGAVNLISQPILFSSGNTTVSAQKIVDAINAYTSTSGYSATIGSSGAYTITGPLATGANINGVSPTFGTVTGTLVLGSAGAFSGGVNSLMYLKNTPVNAVNATAATAAVTVTTAPGAGDTLAMLTVGLIPILAGPITFVGTTVTTARQEIVTAINAYTSTSGYSATGGSGGAFTITAPTASGSTVNGVITTLGAIVGTLAIATNGPFTGGVTAVTAVAAVNYVQGTDYTIDEYGNVVMLIAVPDGSVLRMTYKKLNAAAVTDAVIVGTVDGNTRTGCKLVDSCQTLLKLVPKILIIPGYSSSVTVKAEMERLATDWRMRTFYGSTTDQTKADAIASRGPSGSLQTFNTSSKRAILSFPQLSVYDPQTGSTISTDGTAALAGFMSYCAAVLGPHESTSNREMAAVLGTEIDLIHKWEDASNTADTNQLRAAGIVSVFSDGGFKWWGVKNSSYPANSAVDNNICTIYVNDVITDALTKFAIQYVDRNITSGSISSFVTAANSYYASLMTAGWIGKQSIVSYKKERNPDADLALGKIRFTRNTFYFVAMEFIELEENMEVQLPTIN